MINYLKFKNLLKKHKVNLFDDDYRILYNNMLLLDKQCNYENYYNNKSNKSSDSNQVGGNICNFISPFYLLGKSLDKSKNSILFEKKILMVLNNLKNDNFDSAKFICRKNYCPKII